MACLRLPGSEEYKERTGYRVRTPDSARVGLSFAVFGWQQAHGCMWEEIRWYVAIDGQPVGPFSSKPVLQRYLRMKGLLTREEIEKLWPKKQNG